MKANHHCRWSFMVSQISPALKLASDDRGAFGGRRAWRNRFSLLVNHLAWAGTGCQPVSNRLFPTRHCGGRCLTIREDEEEQHAKANRNHTFNQEEPAVLVSGAFKHEGKQTNHCQPDKPCRPFMPLNPKANTALTMLAKNSNESDYISDTLCSQH